MYSVEVTEDGIVLLNGEKQGVSNAGKGRLICSTLSYAQELIAVLLNS